MTRPGRLPDAINSALAAVQGMPRRAVGLLFGLALLMPSWASGEPSGTATIRYDPGAPNLFNHGIPGPLVGNLFNSQYGEPLASGTIYQASAWISVYYGVRFVVFGPPTAAGQAPRLGSAVVGPPETVARVSFSPPISVPGSFLVGVIPNIAQGLGMATESTQGQGFHAHYWNDNSAGDAANIEAIGGQNAVLRVRGNVAVVPVELMEFDVE